jgi:transcription elongation factor GreA
MVSARRCGPTAAPVLYLHPKGATVLTARPTTRPTDDVLMTQSGYDRLRLELQQLTTTARRELGERVGHARDASANPAENGELMDALDELAALEQRIGELSGRLAMARVAEPAAGEDGIAAIGTRVGVRLGDGKVLHYELVGAGEADPGRQRISISAPIGGAIAGHRAGDLVEVRTPRHHVRFELVSVEPLVCSQDPMVGAARAGDSEDNVQTQTVF